MLAAFYFTVGTLTRNSKIVYGLAVGFYPLLIAYGLIVLRPLPLRWQLALDPLMLGASLKGNGFLHTAEFLNQYVVNYTGDMIANRVVMILVATVCLSVLYVRFTVAERSGKVEKYSTLDLATAPEPVYYVSSSVGYTPNPSVSHVAVPEVARANEGIRASVNKLIAALEVEFQLLRAERSLVVVLPLVIFLSVFEVAFYNVVPDDSYSAAYATNTAKWLTLFLLGITVFYTGEAMHRDREVRIEPVLWATPAPNNAFLLAKFGLPLLLASALIFAVGIAALVIQLLRGHTPIDLLAYVRVYGLILLPSTFFVTALAVLANIVLRNKQVTYVFSIGTAGALFYLFSNGYNHWLYNPVLHGLWTYADLTGVGKTTILTHRIYCLVVASAFLALAHVLYQRRS